MDKALEVGKWIIANYQAIISALVAVMTSLIALFMIIPGEQPEKFLQSVLDFLAKFSRKPELK